MADFIFGVPKSLQMATAAMKKMLTPWKESYDQPRQHFKKQRHQFANKSPSSQGNGFSNSHVWMWELDYKESWVLKHWCFWTVVLGKTLRAPWFSRRSNQSILKKISHECSLKGLLLKLKLQYFGNLRRRAESFEKSLMLGKTEGRRRRGHQRWDGWVASLTQWKWVWVNSANWWWTGRPGVLQSMESQRVGHSWVNGLNWVIILVSTRESARGNITLSRVCVCVCVCMSSILLLYIYSIYNQYIYSILLLNYQTSSLWADADHCWFCCSVAKSCPTFCHPVNCSTPGFPVPHWFLNFDQTGT